MVGNSSNGVISYRELAGVIGALSFAAAFVMAIVMGIWHRDPATGPTAAIILTLMILGLVVSLLNITAKEVVPVLVAAIALVVVGTLTEAFTPLNDMWDGVGDAFNQIVEYFAVFMVPVALVSAIRAVIVLTRPGD